MRRLILSAATFVLMLSSFAQVAGKVTGVVKTSDGKAFSNATIELISAVDSALVKISMSNDNGFFEMETNRQGKFLIAVSAVGFNKYYSPAFSIASAKSQVKLDAIVLTAAETNLKGVTVTARKPFVEQKLDKTLINVDASISNAGSNALEVLEKSPGVTVDKDGNVSLKGRAGVMIMIDGKPSYLSGENLSNYLRSLPASALEQIEIMTNPSAKYDAAGNAGIINIKTKKNKQKGFNGNTSLSYTQGKYWRTSNSLNLNYRNNKWNFFTNINGWRWSGFNNLHIRRYFFEEGSKNVRTTFEQDAYFRMVYSGMEFKVGADYAANKKTSFGIVYTGSYEEGKDNNTNTSFIRNSAGEITNIIDAKNTVAPINKNWSVNGNFKYQLDSNGKELSANLDYLFYDFSTNSRFNNHFYNPSWIKNREDEIIKGDLPSLVKITSFKIDYTHPLKQGAKLEGGIKYSHVNTDNDARYYLVQNGVDVTDANRSNHFVYKENIAAAYINYNKQWKKWGLQLGLRAENTQANGKQYRNDSTIRPEYTSLFPTVYVSYAPKEQHQLVASFGRRIERPAYQDLNPFQYFLDPYTYQQGNPFLRPQFSYNYQLSHTYKNVLTTTLNYSMTTDIFAETMNQLSADTITYVYKENISTSSNYGISISANLNVTKWWSTNVFTNVFHNTYAGQIKNQPLDVAATTALLNVNNQFKFNKGWSAELGGFYRTKGIEGQIIIKPLGQLNAGIQKQILKQKGALKLNVRDAFYTMPFDARFVFHDIDVQIKQRRDSRSVGLTFTYRFGKSNLESRRVQSSAEDEQNRVKKGGSGN